MEAGETAREVFSLRGGMERVFQGPEKVSNLSLQGTGSGAMHSSSEGMDQQVPVTSAVHSGGGMEKEEQWVW